ncbi:ABC transporter permease [Erysipelothrix urinaevulpis]|uniref:ABC transporter permease n=1 Tax=Erysipelothrix urinaevulpis TaxID=2683717 RepID=UPI00135CA1B8|nr:ABC transporter permease [Erysipelothrix urinaevulpis]
MMLVAKLGLRNLFKNKKIAMLSLISIALSVAMTTMVVAFSYSVYEDEKIQVLNSSPRYNILFFHLTDHEKFIEEMEPYMESYSLVTHNSYFLLDDTGNQMVNVAESISEYYPNNDHLSYSLNRLDWIPLRDKETILEGRFPNKNNEMFMSIKMKMLYFPTLKLNDTINLSRKIYFDDGNVETHPVDLKVVGFKADDRMANTSYVYQDKVEGMRIIEVKVNDNIRNINDFIKMVDEKNLINKDQITDGHYYFLNDDLNNFEGLDLKLTENKLTSITIILFMIAVLYLATVSMIYNSFNSRVQQNLHDYGLLRSVGATKKQIRFAIQIESYLLGVVGIILGIALGSILARELANYVSQSMYAMKLSDEPVVMSVVLPLWAVLASFLISLILISFPIWKITHNLFKQTSIESIKEHKRYKKKKRTPLRSKQNIPFSLAHRKLKVDGGGMKGTKWSLTVSLIIFLSITNIVYSTFKNTGSINPNSYNVYLRNSDHETYEDIKVQNQSIQSMYSNVSKKREYYLESINFSGLDVKNDDDEMLISEYEAVDGARLKVTVVDDDSYNKILLNEGLPKETQVILVDKPNDIDENSERLNFYEGQKIKIGKDSDIEMLKIDYVPLTIDSILSESKSDFIRNQINSTKFLMRKTFFESQFKALLDNDYVVNSSFENVIYMNVDEASQFKTTLEKNLGDKVEVINIEEHQMYIINTYKLFDNVFKIILAIVFVIVISNMVSVNLVQLESRKRELSSLMSVGMTKKEVNKMLYYEIIISSIGPFIKATAISIGLLMVYVHFVRKFNPIVTFSLNLKSFIYSLGFVGIFILVNSVVIYQKRKRQSILDGMRSN